MNVYNDIWHSVISECSAENKRKLGMINKNMANIVFSYFRKEYIKLDSDFNQVFNQRLEALGFDPIIFNNNLKKTNSMICGSYPLSCVLFEDYRYSSINIYTRNIGNNDQTSEIDDQNDLDKYIKYNQNIIDYYEDETLNYFRYMSGVKKAFIYDMNSVRIRVIYIDPEISIVDFIDKNYDLSITKTFFDGDNMYINGQDTISKMAYISNSKINKDDYSKEEVKLLLERVAKYLDRGFAINNLEYFISKHQDQEAFIELLNIYGNFKMS